MKGSEKENKPQPREKWRETTNEIHVHGAWNNTISKFMYEIRWNGVIGNIWISVGRGFR